MKLPTFHHNGSSAKMLAESYQHAATELSAALLALENVEINGRDYYPQGPMVYSEAAQEHAERCRQVRIVRDEIQAIADFCWDKVK